MAEQKDIESDIKAKGGGKKKMPIASFHDVQQPPVALGLPELSGDRHSESRGKLCEVITAEINKIMNGRGSEQGIKQVFFTKSVMQ